MEEEGLLLRPKTTPKKRSKKSKAPVSIREADAAVVPEPPPARFELLREASAPPLEAAAGVKYPQLAPLDSPRVELEYPRLTQPAVASDGGFEVVAERCAEQHWRELHAEKQQLQLQQQHVEQQLGPALEAASAPPIDLHNRILAVSAPVPLEDEILRNLYENLELKELHSKVINDFRKNAKYVLVRDQFFETVLEYERSFSSHQTSSAKVKALTISIESLTSKIWIMKKSTQKLSSKCLDGVSLVHIDDLEQLRLSLTKTLSNQVYEKKNSSFRMKMLKLWIQTYIDEHLNAMDAKTLLANPSTQNTSPLISVDSTLFMRDIRGWISHIIGFFQKAVSHCHSYVLLHVIRCPGIGAWGNWYIQWHPPSTSTPWVDGNNSTFLDGYLTELHIFLSPIEELQEEQHVKDIEMRYVAESLRALEESEDWIVVKETEVAEIDTVKAQLTILSDQDYAIFLKQFNLEAMYYSFLENCVKMYMNEDCTSSALNLTEKDGHFLRVFAVTNFILERLSRGLFLFSSRRYTLILKAIAKSVVNLVQILEDSLKASFGTSQIGVILTVNSEVTTTAQSELDGCFVRAVSILLNRTRAGSWEYLTTLPCDLLSDHMKFFVANSILNGEPLNLRNLRMKLQLGQDPASIEDLSYSGISRVLSANPMEAKYLLSFLTRLSISGSDSGYQTRLKEIIAKVVFHFGFVDLDYREELKSECRDFLNAICKSQSTITSLLVTWTRKNFAAMGHLSIYLFQGLPLSSWCPNTPDFDGFVAMLRDPVKSDKFELAKVITAGLNWGLKAKSSSDLFIPRSFHRFLALSLCNLYMDRFMKVPLFSISSALSTTSAIRKGDITSLLPAANEGDFYDWCWNLILGLSLYQQPTSLNTYALDSSTATRSRPFEVLESAQLATLRGAMKTKSLAAYTLLMISDVGHSMAAFERDGWTIVCIVNELFLTFVSTEVLSPSKLTKHVGTSNSVATVQWFLLWTRIAFSDVDWMYNRTCLQLLDSLSQISMLYDQYHVLVAEFQREYVRLIGVHTKPSRYNNMSLFHPVESLYTVAHTIGDYLSTYPTLVTGHASDWYSSIPTPMRGNQLPPETEYIWFAFLALIAETTVEAETRMAVGMALSRDSQTLVSVAVAATANTAGKPLELFATYRWFQQILACPSAAQYSLLPLMLQMFFSLYFEKARSPVVNMNAVFGFRFYSESRETLEKLQKKITQVVLDLSNSSETAEISGFEKDRLCTLFKAALKWLHEPQLVLGSIIHQSPCAMNEFWTDYMSIHLLQNVFIHPHTSNDDGSSHALATSNSATRKLDLYIKETSLPGMPWTQRQTIVTPYSQTTLKIASAILKEDYQTLLTKSRDSAKIDNEYSKYDQDYYVQARPPLHKRDQNGPFRYSYEEVYMKRDVKQSLRENRSHFETLSEWDNMDSKVCVSALRIVRVMEWMKESLEVQEDAAAELEKLFVPFFFKIASLEENVRRYPPYVLMLDRAVQLIGGMFVRGSRTHTLKMFEVIQRGGSNLGAVVDAFNPAAALDEFCDMYWEVTCKEGVSLALLEKFDVAVWLSAVATRGNGEADQSEFFKVVCSIFEQVHTGSLVLNPDLMELQLSNLAIFLKHSAVSESLVDFLLEIVNQVVVEAKIPESVLVKARSVINCGAAFNFNQVLGFELLELQLSKAQALELVIELNNTLSLIFEGHVNGIYGIDHSKITLIVELLSLIYCAKPLYSMLSETERIEIVAHFRKSCQLVLGCVESDNTGDFKLKPWIFQDDNENAVLIASILFRSMEKVFRSLSLVDGMVFELWNILSKVIGLNPPVYWHSFIRYIWEQRQRSGCGRRLGIWSVEVKLFVAEILSACQWPPTADSTIVIENSEVVWPVPLDRIAFFDTVAYRCQNFPQLSFQHLEALEAKSITNFSRDSPLGFCLMNLGYLVEMGGTRESNQADRVKLFIGYLFELLACQLAFPHIITEIMSRVDVASPNHVLLSHGLVRLFSIVNTVEQGLFSKVWDGVSMSIRQTPNSSVWISEACKMLISTEVMTILVEEAIDRHITLSNDWQPILTSLQVPPLDIDGFISNCLHHGLTFNLAEKVIIGEQISIWILKLNKDAIPLQHEEKLLLLLDLFFQLLSVDLQELRLPRHHSRLYSMLPSLAEVILKWSEPANQGLWTSLGLTPKIQFSPAFRVFCKAFATRIVMNFSLNAENGGAVTDLEQREKFVSQVEMMGTSREYSEVVGHVDECVKVLREGSLGLVELRDDLARMAQGSAFVTVLSM
ncbi:hypothetical protein BDR26DRAFT_857531 [Obelidium mucronatum]|nr:hypothetical protein BDR26DRAFT_857531 [Obelidium mucronatum]